MEGRGEGANCNSFAASDAEAEIVRLRKELAAADAFFRQRPMAVLRRVVQLTRLSGGFVFAVIANGLCLVWLLDDHFFMRPALADMAKDSTFEAAASGAGVTAGAGEAPCAWSEQAIRTTERDQARTSDKMDLNIRARTERSRRIMSKTLPAK